MGTPKQRLAALRSGAALTTINRENVGWLESLFLEKKGTKWRQINRWPWDMIILDESQSFKSQSSYRFKALRRLRKLCASLCQLTGTPAPNGYDDLWSQLYLLDGGQRLCPSQTEFRERWMKPTGYEGYSWTVRDASCRIEIQQRVSDIVLSMKADEYLKLPPIIFNKVMTSMTPTQRRIYDRMRREFVTGFNNQEFTAANAAVLQGKLLQLANGAIYRDGWDRAHEVFHDHKLEALEELLEGLSGPVIVAYSYQSDRKRLSEWLTRKGICWAILSADKDFDRFRAGKVNVGVMHPASAGHGLNDLHLSGSENIIWFGLGPNLEYFQQLNARLTGGHRAMGKNIVIHLILMEDTEDLKILTLLTSKDVTQDDLTRSVSELRKSIC